jgi:hypothetical protein
MTKPFLDLLSASEQDDWQSVANWVYANDCERPSTEWGDGPRYLGLSLLNWVALADTSPRLIEICGMDYAIGTWCFNHPDPKQHVDGGEPPVYPSRPEPTDNAVIATNVVHLPCKH